MDPFYFTTDLDYAFGAGSGFNPKTDAQAQTARRTAAAKSARAQKPAANKRARVQVITVQNSILTGN